MNAVKKYLHKTMNINKIAKANVPGLLGVHDVWVGGYVRLML